MTKLSDYVIEALARAGVGHLFMLAGGGCMHLVDSAGHNRRIQYVCCLHEQACAFAAESYAEYGNGLGAVLVTTGPGGTNAITGLAAAWIDSASCIFISGQAKRADLIGDRGVRSMGPQEVDIIPIVRPITKYAVRILDPNSIRYEFEKALHFATTGRRGPVWIDIPLDVQAARIEGSELRGFVPPAADGPAASEVESCVSRAIELFDQAERPAILIGNGVRGAARKGLLADILDVLQAPVLTTWKSLDLLAEDHPLYAGRPGTVGQRGANFVQQNADFLLIAGSRLDLLQTAFNHRNFAPLARKVMVDIDPAEIQKLDMAIDVPACMDAEVFFTEFLRRSAALRLRDRSWWLAQAKQWMRQYPLVLPEYRRDDVDGVNLYVLVDVLSEEASSEDLIVPGSSGPCSEVMLQSFRVKHGQRVQNAPGLGAMGTGLPGAVGACIAGGRRRTLCMNGDGGFQLNIQELETVRRLQLPIKFFILCNGGYASIVSTQEGHFRGHRVGADPPSGLTLPDILEVARAYGIPTAQIHSHAGIRGAVHDVLNASGPMICAVRTSLHQVTAPRVTSSMTATGDMVASPMEDMWPFLSREEFLANMSIHAGVAGHEPR